MIAKLHQLHMTSDKAYLASAGSIALSTANRKFEPGFLDGRR
jgi:hypothetical protein